MTHSCAAGSGGYPDSAAAALAVGDSQLSAPLDGPQQGSCLTQGYTPPWGNQHQMTAHRDTKAPSSFYWRPFYTDIQHPVGLAEYNGIKVQLLPLPKSVSLTPPTGVVS